MNPNNNYFDRITELDIEAINVLVEDGFRHFRNKKEDSLHIQDFHLFLTALFTDFEKQEEEATKDGLQEIFNVFDINGDGKIDKYEFQRLWEIFVVPVLKPKCALIVIDVQNDFIDGSLAIRNCPAGQDGVDVVPVINSILNTVPFHAVVYTYDWHPENHVSFIDNVFLRTFHESSLVDQPEAKVFDTVVFEGPPPTEQKLWPRHCVQKSWGSELHPDLKIVNDAIFIYKGSSPEIDSYSAFWDNQKRSETNLTVELKSRGITDVYICGLAYDYCVGFTALHALENGFATILVEDACRGVSDEDINNMKETLVSKHAVVVTSDVMLNMVNGLERKWNLGYFRVMLIKNKSD